MKKVLIISSSPGKEGNSDILCDEFACGTREAGHDVEKIRLTEKNVGYCQGCYACQKLKKCVKNDDANEIVNKMLNADVIVLATPVYSPAGSIPRRLRRIRIENVFASGSFSSRVRSGVIP